MQAHDSNSISSFLRLDFAGRGRKKKWQRFSKKSTKRLCIHAILHFILWLTLSFPFELADYQSIQAKDNKAVYTATEVECGWAGAVTQKPPVNAKKS